MKNIKYFLILFFFYSLSCENNFIIKDENGNKIGEGKISSIELTSGEEEQKKEQLIKKNVSAFLIKNREVPIIKNYWFLIDSSKYIKIMRPEFDPTFSLNKIDVSIGYTTTLSPIPVSYLIAEGPYAVYNIT